MPNLLYHNQMRNLEENKILQGVQQHPYQMYIITVGQAGLEFQYTQVQFKIPIISAYAKIPYISCCQLPAELLFLL